jgi:hypothetical protein
MEMVCPAQYSLKSRCPRAERMELGGVWVDVFSMMKRLPDVKKDILLPHYIS